MTRPWQRVGRQLHRAACVLGPRWRAWWVRTFLGLNVGKVGVHVKFRGLAHCRFGANFRVGDFCWIEAVTGYAGRRYEPDLRIGRDVAISDLTHISCVLQVIVGDGCLLGSKVYIGDHSHGPTAGLTPALLAIRPALRELDGARPIHLGDRCWVGDGAVILGGTMLCAGSIVAANSVVRLVCDRPALVAGAPARLVRYLDPDPA